MARRILLLTGLASLTLPFFHAALFGLNAMFFWANPEGSDPSGTVSYYVLSTVRMLAGFAIPAFLLVGGYFVVFFTRGQTVSRQLGALRTQIFRLIPLFLIWTTVHFLLQFRPPNSISEALHAYYFLPLMFQLYLLAPLLVSISSTEKGWKWLLAFSILLHIFLEGIQYIPAIGMTPAPWLRSIYAATPIWFFPEHLLWFVMGIVIKIHFAELRESFLSSRRLWLSMIVVFGALSLIEYGFIDSLKPDRWLGTGFNGLIREIYSASVLMYFVTHEKISLPFEKLIAFLGGKSLGIYLTNSPVIYVVSSLIFAFQPWIVDYQIIYQLLLISLGLGIPLLLIYALEHSPIRKAHRFILG